MSRENNEVKDGFVAFRTTQGVEVRATLLRFTRYDAAFEVYSPEALIRTSELLEDFTLFIHDQAVYAGRAVVREAVNTGTATVCAVVLDEEGFDAGLLAALSSQDQGRERFAECLRQWQNICKVLPEFKVAVADIQTFLVDCRRWAEQIELSIRSSPRLDRLQQERAFIDRFSPQVIPVLDTLFEKFEVLAATLAEEQRPIHRSYIQRHLHPIVLCAPFAYRSYQKPLGYAGDYEVVSMMLRDPQEGSSLFAKIFNLWLLHQGAAVAHRNRVQLLQQRLLEETAAAASAGRKARILNLGCGPAWEVQQFLSESELSNFAQFTLMDFNEETLQYASQALRQKQQQHRRTASFELVRKSVQQLLKDVVRADGVSKGNRYDFIYCAGLFDYFPDRTCKQLMALLYQSLAPNGLVLATNVAPVCPNRGSLELILDWHLVYRDALKVAALCPEGLPADAARVHSDPTGVNLFLETRKTNGL